jgi:AraC family transcriptional regulator
VKHIKRINTALNFIEENLHNDFTLTNVSQVAFSSLSYMHRIFYQMTGFTMKEYIRQRRLASAVSLLQSTSKNVLDIALISGFQSAESFTRAFKKQFSLNPSQCRRKGSDIVVCQPLELSRKHEFISPEELDFELRLEAVSLPEVSVSGYMIHTTLENDQQRVDICDFANKTMNSGVLSQHFDLSKTSVYGVYTEMTDQDDFNYTIGGLTSACSNPDSAMVQHTLRSCTYARFKLNRNDRIKEAWHYIYGNWFPQIDNLRLHGYDFEIYDIDSTSIYIPMTRVPMEHC